MSLIAWTALALQGVGSAAPDISRAEREVWVMGTRMQVVVEAPTDSQAAAAAEIAIGEVERLERLLSSWNPSTALSRLNASIPGSVFRLDPELGALLVEAGVWAERTGHAFDPVVGALVDAWGLREGGRVPTEEQIESALAAVGTSRLTVDANEGTASRHDPDAWIDAGGFGKGAALRSVRELLAGLPDLEVRRALIDLGGQGLALAAPEDAPWRIGVAHPDRRAESIARLALRDVSVATSGLSERGGHILDPRTGRPVDDWGSVTVVHPDPLVADILSTALYVMGPDEGMRWLEGREVAVLFLKTAELLDIRWTSAMERWIDRFPVSDTDLDDALKPQPNPS